MKSYSYNVTCCNDESGYLKCEYPEGHNSLLIAHLDTKGGVIPRTVRIEDDIVAGYDEDDERCILGADDRCGVYAILRLLENGYRPQVLFTENEEIGCCGAIRFKDNREQFSTPVYFCIQIDRRMEGNENNYVTYGVSNDKFDAYIESLGFEKMTGTCSDVKHIAPHLRVPGVNVCAGYENEHSPDEYCDLNVVESTVAKLCEVFNTAGRRFRDSD
jgi:di/tripeptidase